MAIELREPRLIEQINRLAAEQAQPAEEVLEKAVQAHLDRMEREAIHVETEAFWDMHDDLVSNYQGEHVALYRGEVVDHDENASQLEKRVRERFRDRPVLIAPVKPDPRRDLRWIGARVEGAQ